MAKDSGLFEMVLVLGIGGFAVLYLTRSFCYGGAFPVDGLCYEGGTGEPGSDECLYDPAACGAVNTDPDYAGGGSAGPKTATPTRADSCNKWGGVWGNDNKCHCNRVVKHCAANAVVNIVNSKCSCVNCPAGTRRSTASAMANSCLKTSAGTVTGSSRCSGKSGNCNWDCKNAYCWTGKGAKVSKVCIRGNSNRSYSCGLARQKFIDSNKVIGTGPAPSGVKIENAKLFIADFISRTVRTCTGIYVSNQKIIQGWPSNVNTLARQNNYTQGAFVQYNNRPFAKLLRDTIVAVIRAYRGNMNPTCNQKMACLNGRSLRECGLA